MAESKATAKLLQNALKDLTKDPVEGFVCELIDDSNLFQWRVFLEGPKDTPYEGGIFELLMKFPQDYPMSPPSLTFVSEFWHPNVYEDGKVCISILHPPGEDPMSGELPEERWLPTQTVGTILLSVISLLGDPNISSPANVDASVQWRKDRDSYNQKCKALSEKAKRLAPPTVKIPHPDSNPAERRREEVHEDDFDVYSYDDDDEDGGGDFEDFEGADEEEEEEEEGEDQEDEEAAVDEEEAGEQGDICSEKDEDSYNRGPKRKRSSSSLDSAKGDGCYIVDESAPTEARPILQTPLSPSKEDSFAEKISTATPPLENKRRKPNSSDKLF